MPKPSPSKKTSSNFAAQFTALEKVVARLESRELDLDESLAEFETGLKLAQALQQALKKTETQIETLKAAYSLDS